MAFCIQGGTQILSVQLNESSHGENIHVTTTRIKTQRRRLQQHPSRLLPGSPQLPAPPRSPPILALRAVGEHRARSRPRGLCRSALSVGFAQAGGRGSLSLPRSVLSQDEQGPLDRDLGTRSQFGTVCGQRCRYPNPHASGSRWGPRGVQFQL